MLKSLKYHIKHKNNYIWVKCCYFFIFYLCTIFLFNFIIILFIYFYFIYWVIEALSFLLAASL